MLLLRRLPFRFSSKIDALNHSTYDQLVDTIVKKYVPKHWNRITRSIRTHRHWLSCRPITNTKYSTQETMSWTWEQDQLTLGQTWHLRWPKTTTRPIVSSAMIPCRLTPRNKTACMWEAISCNNQYRPRSPYNFSNANWILFWWMRPNSLQAILILMPSIRLRSSCRCCCLLIRIWRKEELSFLGLYSVLCLLD